MEEGGLLELLFKIIHATFSLFSEDILPSFL